MNRTLAAFGLTRRWLGAISCLLFLSSARAQTNSGINTNSATWDIPSCWSLGVLPNLSNYVELINPGMKTVTIDTNTAQSNPGSMTVSNLDIANDNTLFLNGVGTNTPFRAINSLHIGLPGGKVKSSDSELQSEPSSFILAANCPKPEVS
jgi:hypothetical protein